MSEVLTPEQVAAEWHCSPATVRKRLRSGALGGYLEPGSIGWRTTRADVDAYVDARRVTGAGRLEPRSDRAMAARRARR